MKLAEMLDQLPVDDAGGPVYGEPYQTPDGATVITVTRVRGGGVGKAAGGRNAAGFTASPVGVFVIRGEHIRWVPAVDASRVALIGVTTGLLAAVIGSLAVLRRPPWPHLHGPIELRHRKFQGL
ncbi:MAG: hypothetical protein ACRDTN_18585 [Mycobacterium sp.]